ncbi:MAG: hypothetical protein DLM60_09220 [Pseudonocardiales bacterium]|nr:MAG: hypothetical protein DLM60_09220 [Pseudonocardiales bacterium]
MVRRPDLCPGSARQLPAPGGSGSRPEREVLRGSRAAEAAALGVVGRVRRRSRLRAATVRLSLRRMRAVVAQRREDYQRELRRRQVPRIMLSDGTQPEALASPDHGHADGQLAGTPASAGTVTATARVVLDPVGARLEPGEILVAPSTDPGWTPLFLTAGGLVMEMGGANSHGAVVARGYGIPAVVGVPDATLRTTTGQQITVAGATGLVQLY